MRHKRLVNNWFEEANYSTMWVDYSVTWVIPEGNLKRGKRHNASGHEEDKKRAQSWVVSSDELITLGPSVPGVPGRPRGPCRP